VNLSDSIADVAQLAATVKDTLAEKDTRDGLTIPDRIRASYNGWPAGSGFDGGGKSSVLDDQGIPMPNVADPTGEAAMRQDRARDDERTIHRDIEAAKRALHRALINARRYRLRTANPHEQDDASDGDDGCQSCARITGPSGLPWWNPIHRYTVLANGVRVAVCDWCYNQPRVGVRHTGELPPKDAVESHRDGRRYRKAG
jgi:hypothetical protein